MSWSFCKRPAPGLAFILVACASAFGQSTAAKRAFALQTQEATVLVEWLTDSTFRFCAAWEGLACIAANDEASDVKVGISEQDANVIFETQYLRVVLSKIDLRLKVTTWAETVLLEDSAGIRRLGAGIEVERATFPEEKFYGFGPRTEPVASLHGTVTETTHPFVISSRGYGLHHTMPGLYRFDFGATRQDRQRVFYQGLPKFEFWFYYGPSIKSIYEEHSNVVPPRFELRFDLVRPGDVAPGCVVLGGGERGGWAGLERALRQIVHAGLSGIYCVGFDFGAFGEAEAALRLRAAQLAVSLPLAVSSPNATPRLPAGELASWLAWKRRWRLFWEAYECDVYGRGLPVVRPMVMQFPKDPAAERLTDQFMLGDELLVAPIYRAGGSRTVYLPMGQWTHWETGRRYAGRQLITIEAGGDLPVFVRNGSIVPLISEASPEVVELHYFPRLPGEFFIYEADVKSYTQVHAAPAQDLLRLDIVSRKPRVYRWVVHHVGRPAKLGEPQSAYQSRATSGSLTPGTWHYDPKRQLLHAVVQVGANEKKILYIYPAAGTLLLQ